MNLRKPLAAGFMVVLQDQSLTPAVLLSAARLGLF